jgi:site-specific DNA-methyltransferase (adenine-specific)
MTVEILNIDCMEYMAGLADNAFDLAIVDPPYGINCDGIGMSNRSKPSKKFRGAIKSDYKGGAWDSNSPDKLYFKELFRVSKNQVIWGANHFIEKFCINSSCWVVWYKKQNPNDNAADCELAWTSFKTAVRMVSIPWSGFGHINLKETRIHPTQKPVKLYQWLLANYAKEGDRILDTHLGSGSNAIANYRGGFDFVGCELDEDYYKDSIARFDAETSQGAFF